ncbi:MAG: hypothetical protein PVI57_19725 [Gemmatimonadota bacterium]|jgi:TolB protein
MKSQRTFGLALLAGAWAATLSACGGEERPARGEGGEAAEPAPWSIERAEVLFTGRRGGSSDLYVLHRATGDTVRLTRFGERGRGANAPALSPDGRRVAFQVRRESDFEIHVGELNGETSIDVTDHPEWDVNPVWDPGGTRLGFMSTRGFELGGIGPFPGHVYVLDLTDGSLRQVTREPLTSSLGPSDWSADGSSMLVARASGDGDIDVFLLDVETGAEARLTDGPASEYSAVFSHDGERIAYHAELGGESQIVVARRDGGEPRAVTSGPGLRYVPQWSPDDAWILFTASEDGEQYDLRAVRVEDGVVVDIVATPEDDREGVWIDVGSGPPVHVP